MKTGRWRGRPSLEAALVASNAALYSAVGLATYFGVFAPVFGTVRFWPGVVVPAAFAVLFSPRIGALGAAIGIFISDMVVHGNPLLSITVGVPANFIGFYLVGALARGEATILKRVSAGLIQVVPLAAALSLYAFGLLDELTSHIFLAVAVAVLLIGAGLAYGRPDYSKLIYASSSGLMAGSAIIGLGLWAFSQFFALPFGVSSAPITAALVWFLWTYLTEIPFLAFLLPPLVYGVARAMPERIRKEALVT